ncbi:MAG: helix-turn-helix transcriptional regulator [Clostridia bacterium]|nr:helix-turn-helix transcriptional regulator [Clostridia bacterium]
MLKIKELRREFGYTQEELAEKMGLKYYNIGDWERGKCEPCNDDLIKLSKIFDVTVDYLIGNNVDEFGSTRTQSVAPMGDTLTQDEKDLLKAFGELGPFERDFFLKQIKATAAQGKLIKK